MGFNKAVEVVETWIPLVGQKQGAVNVAGDQPSFLVHALGPPSSDHTTRTAR
jgi:hypothetical protein